MLHQRSSAAKPGRALERSSNMDTPVRGSAPPAGPADAGLVSWTAEAEVCWPSMLGPTDRRFERWEALPALGVGALLLLWALPAMKDVTPDDLRVLYAGGTAAWETGHPERTSAWLSTAFLGLVMALVSRTSSLAAATVALNAANLLLVLASLAVVWSRLRGLLRPLPWWATLACAVSYSPILSTIRWKQLNLVVFFLALAGFILIRRGRMRAGAVTVGLSLALKPLVIVLPLALLSRRDTRAAGAGCLAATAALTLLGQGFLALRAHDIAVLSPVPVLQNFGRRAAGFQSLPENLSPQALVQRLTRRNDPMQSGTVLFAVAVALLLANESIRRRPGSSWEVFAFALLLSTLVGPISWPHYQVLLLPMFVLLAYRFSLEQASPVFWLTLVFAFILTSLVQRPLELTIPGALRVLATGRRETWDDVVQVLMLSQFAPYFLYLAAFGWFSREP